jgi:hypothetical protein
MLESTISKEFSKYINDIRGNNFIQIHEINYLKEDESHAILSCAFYNPNTNNDSPQHQAR